MPQIEVFCAICLILALLPANPRDRRRRDAGIRGRSRR